MSTNTNVDADKALRQCVHRIRVAAESVQSESEDAPNVEQNGLEEITARFQDRFREVFHDNPDVWNTLGVNVLAMSRVVGLVAVVAARLEVGPQQTDGMKVQKKHLLDAAAHVKSICEVAAKTAKKEDPRWIFCNGVTLP